VSEKTVWVFESSVVTYTVVYHTIPILLTFKILPFIYANPVFLYDAFDTSPMA